MIVDVDLLGYTKPSDRLNKRFDDVNKRVSSTKKSLKKRIGKLKDIVKKENKKRKKEIKKLKKNIKSAKSEIMKALEKHPEMKKNRELITALLKKHNNLVAQVKKFDQYSNLTDKIISSLNSTIEDVRKISAKATQAYNIAVQTSQNLQK